MALTGTKALTVWCKQATNGYKDVEIRNMTSCWRDGLAFCAILHHYRPDLINFDKLSKENIAENNHLAFTVAEQELGIPALLDVEDMVELTVPDKLSILTYVSQYYNYFKDKIPGEIPTRHASKRQSPYTVDDLPKKKQATSVPGMSAAKEVIGASPTPNIAKGTMDRFCANCGKTVYLMERLQVEGKLFHRVCFKCNTCETQLRMGTYRYIPVEDKFYCDKHYRKRTTSTSSDDSSKSRNGNQKSEQDALQILLESLENKRKSTKKIEEKEGMKEKEEKHVMKHSSVHNRIANARKKFMETEEPMEVDHETTAHKQRTQKEDLKSPTTQSPSHAPPRPTAPPERPPYDPKKKGVDSSHNPGAIAGAKANLQNELAKHMPPLSQPLSKNISKEAKKEPPGRPSALPKESNTESKGANEQNVQSKMQARGFLSNVIPKMNPPKHHAYVNVPIPHEVAKAQNMEEQGDKGGKKDKAEVNIYERPFAASVNYEEKNKTEEFDNPRYLRNLKLDTTPVYSNQGSSLLTIGSQNKGLECKSDEEASSKDHDADFRPKSDSVSSGGGKKKKLVLKVKKKKPHEESSPRESMNLNVDDTKEGKGDKAEDTSQSSEGQRQEGGEGSEQEEDKCQEAEGGKKSMEKEEQKGGESVQVGEEAAKGDKEGEGLAGEGPGVDDEGQKAENEGEEAKDEGQGSGIEGGKVKTDVEDLSAKEDKIVHGKSTEGAADESNKDDDHQSEISNDQLIGEKPKEQEPVDVEMEHNKSENVGGKDEEGEIAARKSGDEFPEKSEQNMESDEQMGAGEKKVIVGDREADNVEANEVEMKEREEGRLTEGEETMGEQEQNLDEDKEKKDITTAGDKLGTEAKKIEQEEPEREKTKTVLKYVNPFEDSDEEMMPEKDNNKRKEKIILNPFEVDTDDDLDNDDENLKFDSSEEFVWDESIGRAVSRRAKLVPGEGPKTTMSAEEFAKHLKKIDDLKKGLAKTGKKDCKNPFEDSDDELDRIHEKGLEKSRKQDGKPRLLVLKTKKKRKAPPPPTQAPLSQGIHTEAKEEIAGESTESIDKETSVIMKIQEKNLGPEQKQKPEPILVAPDANLAPKDPLETFKTYVDNSEVEIRKRLDSKSDGLRRYDEEQVDRATSPVSASCPALNKMKPHGEERVIKSNDKSTSSDYLPENNQRREHETGIPQQKQDHQEEGKELEIGVGKTTPEVIKKKEKPPKRPAPPVPKGITPFKDSPPSTPQSAAWNGTPDAGKKAKESPARPDEGKEGDGVEQSKKLETPERVTDVEKEKMKKKVLKTKSPKEKDKSKEKGKEEKEKSKVKEKEGKEKREGKVKEEKEKKKQKKDKKNKSPKVTNERDKPEEVVDEQEVETTGLVRTYSIIEEKELTIEDIGIELKEIESKQQVLEAKGVNMEKRLRDILHGEPEEGYMITWFDLVTEKNKLLRRENELIYMSQEIEYRNNQKRIEFELRHLMEKEESTKTEEDRKAEEMLLDQLVNYVSRRNKIVEKIEQDRRREREEDEQIQMILQAQGLHKKHKKKKAGKKNSAGTTFYA
eukprot:Seg1421.5 transcript_id=Seg1421.5/GoldUCD/mRNA.D3Y31 product="MICAL-like protein 2" protein_id=Seg1421.5/GoldUCD/D3Y31